MALWRASLGGRLRPQSLSQIKDVDGRDEPGHDEWDGISNREFLSQRRNPDWPSAPPLSAYPACGAAFP